MRFDRLILVLLLCVLPGAFWPGSTSYEAAKFLLLSVLGGAYLLNSARQIYLRHTLFRPTINLAAPWLGLLVIILLSGALGANLSLVTRTATLTLTWMMILWVAFTRTTTVGNLLSLLRALTAGAVLTSLYGLAQIYGLAPGPAIELATPPGISTFGNENQMSGLAALAVWPAAALVLLAPRRPEKFLATVGFIVLVSTVFLASATGPRLAVAGAGAIILPGIVLLQFGQRRAVPWFTFLALGFGSLAAVWFFAGILEPQWAFTPDTPGFVTNWMTENNGHIRRTDWLIAWHMHTVNGAAFAGAGNYQALWPEVRAALTVLPSVGNLAEHIPVATRAHNEYLQLIAELGLPGALSVVILSASLLAGFHRRWKQISTRRLARVWLLMTGCVFTFAIHALVSFPAHLPAPAVLFAIILGSLGSPAFRTDKAILPSVVWPRFVMIAPLICGVVVAGLGVRQFAGDLQVARGEKLYLAGEFSAALREFEQGDRLITWANVGDLYQGLTLLSLNRTDDALVKLAASLEHHPTYEGMLAVAELKIEQSRFPEAMAQIARVENCGPVAKFRRQARYLRGLAFLRQDDFDRARPILDALVLDSPRFVRGLLGRGYLAAREGDFASARKFYRVALNTVEEDLKAAVSPEEKKKLTRMRDTARRSVQSVE